MASVWAAASEMPGGNPVGPYSLPETKLLKFDCCFVTACAITRTAFDARLTKAAPVPRNRRLRVRALPS